MSQLRLKSNVRKESVMILCVVAFILIFALWRVLSTVLYHQNNSIADTNGSANFSLNTLTQEDILSERYGYTMYASSTRGEGNSTNVGYEWEEEDRDLRSMSAKSFSGVTVLQSTKVNTDTLMLDINSTVDSGNFRIVITVDGVFYDDVEINQNVRVELNNIQNKTILIKLAGESAAFQASVTRSY